MKYLSTLILFLIMSVTGCSSSVKFTGEEKAEKKSGSNNRYDEKKKEEVKNSNDLPAEQEKKIETDLPQLAVPGETVLESATGVASFYSKKFHGRKTANGEIYDMNDYTAAHGTYPFNTLVKVTNLANNKSIKLRINDRKPTLNGRLIDVSYAAAKDLEFVINGIAKVQVDVLSWGSPPVK